MTMNKRSGLICPCCAPTVTQEDASNTVLLDSGWAVRLGGVPRPPCPCGAPAEVRDLDDERVWCTDCWVAEALMRETVQDPRER